MNSTTLKCNTIISADISFKIYKEGRKLKIWEYKVGNGANNANFVCL